MAEFSSHAPGTFSWAELATTDQKGGVAFYKSLFDWGVKDVPIGPTEVYSMFTLRGQEVGAAVSLPDDERKLGIPSHWNMYVTVANVDESTKKAESLGGKVLAPPFDVMDAGRMAVLQDPTGAVFCLWQAGRSIGARILYEPGALCWTELTTRDPTDGGNVLYGSLWLGGETQRAWSADGVHGVQQQRAADRRHDEDAGADAGPGTVGTGCRISRCRIVTPARRSPSRSAPRE